MEKALGDLLEEMDRVYPGGYSLNDLDEKGFSEAIVFESQDKGFIDRISEMNDHSNDKLDLYNLRMVLTSNGFLALNQIRMKRVTEELNNSVKKFSQESSRAGKRIEILTWVMAILALITAIPLINIFAKLISTYFTRAT